MSRLSQRMRAVWTEGKRFTHYERCEEVNPSCAIAKLCDQVEDLERQVEELKRDTAPSH